MRLGSDPLRVHNRVNNGSVFSHPRIFQMLFFTAVEVLHFMIQVQLADHLRAKSGVVNTASRASSSVHVGQRISLF